VDPQEHSSCFKRREPSAMDDYTGRRALVKTTARHAIAQLLAVSICSAILLLFAALTYSRITLPHYTSKYAQKDTQQVVNLIIAVVATIVGILLNHCRRCVHPQATHQQSAKEAPLELPMKPRPRASCVMQSSRSLVYMCMSRQLEEPMRLWACPLSTTDMFYDWLPSTCSSLLYSASCLQF
jgi:hypothetical protein